MPEIARDARRVGFPPGHPPMRGLLGVPVRAREEVVGDLYLAGKTGAPEFLEEDQRLVELLAAHAGIAIENARLHAREREWRQTLLTAIDSQRRQAATLRQQAELIDLAHDAIIVRDPEGRVIHWNQGAQETYGWGTEEAIGRVTHTLVQTAFPNSREEAERALLGTGSWEGELRHMRRNGARIVVESRQALVRDAEGAPQSVLEINRDITARKRAEGTLGFLAEAGAAPVASLDAGATLDTPARLAVPHLGDWCATYLLAEDGGSPSDAAIAPAPCRSGSRHRQRAASPLEPAAHRRHATVPPVLAASGDK